jgi:hypothetical protein
MLDGSILKEKALAEIHRKDGSVIKNAAQRTHLVLF